MKKIRFIKENDLFDWKVGDIIDVEKIDYDLFETTYIKAIESGYVEWVKEEGLVDRVDRLIDGFILSSDIGEGTKYECIELYDYIVKELNGDWEPNFLDETKYKFAVYYAAYDQSFKILDPEKMYQDSPLLHAKSEEICQAIIDSKKMRPYLDRIFGVKEGGDTNNRLLVCDECGKSSKDVKYTTDPFEEEVYLEEVWKNFCDECYQISVVEI